LNESRKDNLNNVVKELLFDLSSDEKTVRAGAISGLLKFATLEPVAQAAREIFDSEQDPHCKQGLQEILDIYERNSGDAKIRLVRSPHFKQPDTRKLSPGVQPEPEAPKLRLVDSKIRTHPPRAGVHTGSASISETRQLADKNTVQTAETGNKDNMSEADTPKLEQEEQPAQSARLPLSLEELKKISNDWLEWAAQNNLRVSQSGLGIILTFLLCFALIVSYNIYRGNVISYSGESGKLEHAINPGQIQTGEIPRGEIIKGTLKEYNNLAQIWFFLADDGRLFKLKLDKSPSYYRVEEYLEVLVEGCSKNSLGHTILMGKAEKKS